MKKGEVMANHMEEIQKSYFENLSKDLCSTCEGSQFMAKYMTSRSAISDLEKKVLEVIKDSDISTAEAIGFRPRCCLFQNQVFEKRFSSNQQPCQRKTGFSHS